MVNHRSRFITLYKYGAPKWIDSMIQHGDVRIGTLEDFRVMESKDRERGDFGEGTREIHSDVGPTSYTSGTLPAQFKSSLVLEGDAKFVIDGPYTITNHITVANAYIYCLTEIFSEDVMKRFGGACTIVKNPTAFFRTLDEGLRKVSEAITFKDFAEVDRCVYVDRRQHYQSIANVHECFMKPLTLQHQKEVRIVWHVEGTPISSLNVQLPEVCTYVERYR